jgi:uncharacterized protein
MAARSLRRGLPYGDEMGVTLRVGGDLATLFVPAKWRSGEATLSYDGTSSLGHLVESVGVPLPEVGSLRIDGREVAPPHRVSDGDVVIVEPVPRPQRLDTWPPRFVLDVHLGKLARRLRVLGVDAAYHPDADDDDLLAVAAAEGRFLLTKDRALLMRRALPAGAYVRGAQTEAQLTDVLDRFEPPLAPYQRCPNCNGTLVEVPKSTVEDLLEPGTRRSYDEFARCRRCDQVYWRGAHFRRLDALVRRAIGHAVKGR